MPCTPFFGFSSASSVNWRYRPRVFRLQIYQLMKQQSFFQNSKSKREHGGSLLLGRRRSKRPLSVKEPLHLVLRSDFAFGKRSLTKHRNLIERVIQKYSKRFRIRVYEKAIVTNHIHLLAKGQSRAEIANFFRVTAGQIAQEILKSFPILPSEKPVGGGTSTGRPEGRSGGTRRESENTFWQTRIYSRILSWGREFKAVTTYVIQNSLEALGLVPYKPRKNNSS